ncbi:MAG TPA: HAMP domain-containing sensor histidine kinase [Anaerolineae bacterium]|nr:HAMP domain-containing sensor histidine kinase [Anaerolineae bacterium]HQK14103.1 HAMP domain-containing sensor histidine kinase [Anaerolineae bacterium]
MVTESIPGEQVRRETAHWALSIYAGLAAFGIALHIIRNLTPNRHFNWLYLLLMAIIGLTALVSRCYVNRSLSRAMLSFAWITFVCFAVLLIYEIITGKNYEFPMAMFYVGIFTLGFILGFKPVIYYATATAAIFIILGFRYLGIFNIIIPVVLVYAMAVPAKIVERLIEQSTRDLAQLNARLEELVAARTAELAKSNRQLQAEILERIQLDAALQQRTLELESRNEDLNAYAHTVAHDIKAPLATIVGFSELLEKRHGQYPPDKLSDYFNILARTGRKIANIVDELLLLASVREVQVLETCLLDMTPIVQEALQRLTDLMTDSQPDIVFPDTWPAAVGYAPWVEEVWANYISNAIKYGGKPLRIELGATLSGNSHVRFWVRDNGKGLTPEEQARLFTPFTRFDHANARGHGLGLSIVKRIVEKLGGQVGVESEVGQGSTFFFTLPGVESKEQTPSPIPNP